MSSVARVARQRARICTWLAGVVVTAPGADELAGEELEAFKCAVQNLRREFARRGARGRKTRPLPPHAPFGFRLTGPASVEPHPDEWPTLQMIRELHAQGVKATHIAQVLNARGLRARKGGEFSGDGVATILERVEKLERKLREIAA